VLLIAESLHKVSRFLMYVYLRYVCLRPVYLKNESEQRWEKQYFPCLGLARTIYIQCIHGIFGREITNFMVIYGDYIRFWPTLFMPASPRPML